MNSEETLKWYMVNYEKLIMKYQRLEKELDRKIDITLKDGTKVSYKLKEVVKIELN